MLFKALFVAALVACAKATPFNEMMGWFSIPEGTDVTQFAIEDQNLLLQTIADYKGDTVFTKEQNMMVEQMTQNVIAASKLAPESIAVPSAPAVTQPSQPTMEEYNQINQDFMNSLTAEEKLMLEQMFTQAQQEPMTVTAFSEQNSDKPSSTTTYQDDKQTTTTTTTSNNQSSNQNSGSSTTTTSRPASSTSTTTSNQNSGSSTTTTSRPASDTWSTTYTPSNSYTTEQWSSNGQSPSNSQYQSVVTTSTTTSNGDDGWYAYAPESSSSTNQQSQTTSTTTGQMRPVTVTKVTTVTKPAMTTQLKPVFVSGTRVPTTTTVGNTGFTFPNRITTVGTASPFQIGNTVVSRENTVVRPVTGITTIGNTQTASPYLTLGGSRTVQAVPQSVLVSTAAARPVGYQVINGGLSSQLPTTSRLGSSFSLGSLVPRTSVPRLF